MFLLKLLSFDISLKKPLILLTMLVKTIHCKTENDIGKYYHWYSQKKLRKFQQFQFRSFPFSCMSYMKSENCRNWNCTWKEKTAELKLLKFPQLLLTVSVIMFTVIANTKKYLQSDWLREVQYWPYLYSVFNIFTLSLNNNKKNQHLISVVEK